MDFIKELIANPEQAALILAAIIGTASLIGKALVVVTGITASKKDDVYASKFVKAVAWLQTALDKVGLNPKQ
jgi:hypothetical protein